MRRLSSRDSNRECVEGEYIDEIASITLIYKGYEVSHESKVVVQQTYSCLSYIVLETNSLIGLLIFFLRPRQCRLPTSPLLHLLFDMYILLSYFKRRGS